MGKNSLISIFAILILITAVMIGSVSAQQLSWTTQLGTEAFEEGISVAMDDTGGVYLGGYTAGSLGNENLGDDDAYIARLNASGKVIWTRQFGTIFKDRIQNIASDGSGGVFVVGLYEDQGALGDFFIARFDKDGNQLWLKQNGTSASDGAYALLVQDKRVMIAGHTNGNLGGKNAGGSDVFLASYDFEGNQLWLLQIGSVGRDIATSLAPDKNGEFFLGGIAEEAIANQSFGGEDGFLAKYNSSGKQIWIKQFGTGDADALWALASDGKGGVYAGGQTFGLLGDSNAGRGDAFLIKFKKDGSQKWIHQFGTENADSVSALTPDVNGGVITVGSTEGSLFNASFGPWDAHIARYHSSGRLIWGHQFGTSQNDFGHAVVSNSNLPRITIKNNVLFVGGRTDGSLGEPNQGNFDSYVARYTY